MSSISLIIPVYNMRRQLMRCLDALSQQTVKPDEAIVVDDGSTDGMAAWLHGCMAALNFSVKLICQEHGGAAAARNRGFAESKGEYVIFLDADVVLKKHALQRYLEALQQAPSSKLQAPVTAYAYSSFRWGWKRFSSFPFDGERLKQMPYIHTTSLIKRQALPEKPFDESLKRLQDWDFYLTLLEKGYKGVYVPEVLFTVETRGTMSDWLPSRMYQIPFEKYGIRIKALKKYREAEKIVKEKHGLTQISELKTQNHNSNLKAIGV